MFMYCVLPCAMFACVLAAIALSLPRTRYVIDIIRMRIESQRLFMCGISFDTVMLNLCMHNAWRCAGCASEIMCG